MRRWQWISTALAAIYGLGWAGLFALPLHGTHLASVALYSDLFIIIAVIAFFSYRSATYLAVLPVLLAWLVSDTVLSDTALSNTLLPSTGLSETHAFGMPEALIFFTVLVRVVMVIMVREYLYYWFHSSVWHGYQEQRLRLELANVALIDPLTGLQNHKHFDIVMEREVLSARRDNTQLAVVALSIAPLRWYGMTYGQEAAKALVKRIGRGLRRGTFRPRDFLARLNGDEFVVVLPDTDIEGAKVVVARLQQLVHQSCDTVIHQRLKQPVVVKGLVMEWQPDVSVHQFKRALSTQLTQLPAQDADTVIWQPE
ncbi:diguanylate cyclase [Photobacterium aphoticum]|uniref:diguanylate cyclase n=1 Tax=Photobacterium aphoticum TaxID=754436 RepID=A0A090QYM2_9GAMM|nr:diguanylate cyclase [Photobacterium aphoticum]